MSTEIIIFGIVFFGLGITSYRIGIKRGVEIALCQLYDQKLITFGIDGVLEPHPDVKKR